MRARHVALVAGACLLEAGIVAAQTPLGDVFTYRGHLMQNGQPATGNKTLLFELYDASSGGTLLGSNSIPTTLDANGLFTVPLDFGVTPFTTFSERWLQITVDGTPLSPRQLLTPAPFSLATRGINVTATGNVGIGTTTPTATLEVANGGGETLIYAANDWIGVRGVHNSTTGTLPGVLGETDSLATDASGSRGDVNSTAPGARSAGVWGRNFSTTGNGYGVRGTHDGSGAGVFGEVASSNGYAGYFAGRVEVADTQAKLRLTSTGGSQGSQLDIKGPGPSISGAYGAINFLDPGDAQKARIRAYTSLIGDGLTLSAGSTGLLSISGTTGNVDVGSVGGNLARLRVQTTGLNLLPAALLNDDIVVEDHDAVVGLYSSGSGSRGSALVLAEVDGSGNLVDKWSILRNTTGGGGALAIKYGNNPDYSSNSTKLVIETDGDVGIGTSSPAAELHVNGTARFGVVEITGADVAEKFPVTDAPQPGMVMEIDPDHTGQLRVAHGAYNRRVAGVVSGANGLSAGTVLGHLHGYEDAPPIALTGRVWVYADATSHPIAPGDLLTTAETPGHAMKVTDHSRAVGAILGKAMSNLKEGKGLVLMLVNLQ